LDATPPQLRFGGTAFGDFIMRNTSMFLLVLPVVAACGGAEPSAALPVAPATTAAPVETVAPTATATATPAPPKLTMAELQTKGLAEYVAAFNAHDAKKMSALYTDGASSESFGAPPKVGRAAIESGAADMFTAIPDAKMMPSLVLVAGDVTVVQFAVSGTNTGTAGPLAASGKPVGAVGALVLWWTPEGQIKLNHSYTDGLTILAQMGVVKQKAPGIPVLASRAETLIAAGSEAEKKNIETLKPFYAAMEKKSVVDFTATMTDTTEWYDNMQTAPSKGKADAKKFFDAHLKGFPDARMATLASWAVGDYVVSEVLMSGTNTGPLFGMKATGKPVNVHSLDIIQMKDGKMVKGSSFANGIEPAVQLGMGPAGTATVPPAAVKPPATKAPAKK
jgi:predicted ester cyclase